MPNQSTPDTPSQEEEPQDFAVFLMALGKGRVYRELCQRLQELTAAVTDTGKPGTLTLTIGIKPQSNTDAVTVSDKVTVKAPALDRPNSIFFVDEDNHHLVRDNPQQQSMFQEPVNR